MPKVVHPCLSSPPRLPFFICFLIYLIVTFGKKSNPYLPFITKEVVYSNTISFCFLHMTASPGEGYRGCP